MGSHDERSRCFPAIVTLLIFTLLLGAYFVNLFLILRTVVWCTVLGKGDMKKQNKKWKNENGVQNSLLIHEGIHFATFTLNFVE